MASSTGDSHGGASGVPFPGTVGNWEQPFRIMLRLETLPKKHCYRLDMADERSEWFSTLRWIYSETELTHFQAVCGLHTHTHMRASWIQQPILLWRSTLKCVSRIDLEFSCSLNLIFGGGRFHSLSAHEALMQTWTCLMRDQECLRARHSGCRTCRRCGVLCELRSAFGKREGSQCIR